MQEVNDFLNKCVAYYLATVEGDQPRVRPFGTVDIFEGKLYIQTAKSKDVSKQIQENPKVELCACDGEKWLRVTGKLVRDDRDEAREAMLAANESLKDMYHVGDGIFEVLYLADAACTKYSFTAEPVIIA